MEILKVEGNLKTGQPLSGGDMGIWKVSGGASGKKFKNIEFRVAFKKRKWFNMGVRVERNSSNLKPNKFLKEMLDFDSDLEYLK